MQRAMRIALRSRLACTSCREVLSFCCTAVTSSLPVAFRHRYSLMRVYTKRINQRKCSATTHVLELLLLLPVSNSHFRVVLVLNARTKQPTIERAERRSIAQWVSEALDLDCRHSGQNRFATTFDSTLEFLVVFNLNQRVNKLIV